MKWIATECAWFSAFFEKPLLNLANLFIDMRMVRFCRSTEGTGFEIPVPCHPQWSRGSPRSAIRAEETGCIGVRSDSLQEGTGFEIPVLRQIGSGFEASVGLGLIDRRRGGIIRAVVGPRANR